MSKRIVEEIEKELLPITKDNSFTGSIRKDLMIGELLSYAKNLKEQFDKVFDFMLEHDMLECMEESDAESQQDAQEKK